MIPLNLLFISMQVFLAISQTDAIRHTLVRSVLFLPALIHATHGVRRDAAAQELSEFKANYHSARILTTGTGVPIDDKNNILTIGPRGPALLQDSVFLDEMAHFSRERIPERVVHAKGAGAFGYFEVINDVTRYTKLSALSFVGKRTRVAVRFSTRAGESGTADTVLDSHGFAVKFYTEEGIWDLLGQGGPIVFNRDPMSFPSLIHAQKRNPVTHLTDYDMLWDFNTLRPETTHGVMNYFLGTSIPDGYRHMNGFPVNIFKLVNARGEAVYCRFQMLTNQGSKHLSSEKAAVLAGIDPDYCVRDLYNAIKNNNHPSWTVSMQVMTFEEAESYKYNPFDVTKIWPASEFPVIPIGTLVLNENPSNYFTDVEQLAFSPAHMPPGIEPSPDKVLQGRLFAYSDAQRYRLGSNYQQLPVNCPLSKVANYLRDGPHNTRKYDGGPNYYPNSFNGPKDNIKYKQNVTTLTGDVARYNSSNEDNFSQPRELWLSLKEKGRNELVKNLAVSLSLASGFIQERAVDNFRQVHVDFARRLSEKLEAVNSKN